MTVFVPYAYPTRVRSVSDSFTAHMQRTPPSVNPGTDYKASYGSAVTSVADGYVVDIIVTNYGSGGRMIYVDHDDGTGVDYLHLSRVDVVKGERVLRNQYLGLSGASGFHDDHYYGPHLHISIRNKHGFHAENSGNYDFDATIKNQWDTAGWASDGGSVPIVNTPTPTPTPTEDDDMKRWKYGDKYAIFDHVNKTFRVIEDKVSTEWNGFVNEEARGVFFQTVDDANWADLTSKARGFVRVF